MKMAAGARSPADVEAWQRRAGRKGRISHVTRTWPKRADEVLDGGSIYWAAAKKFCWRQRIVAFEPAVVGGVKKCRIVLDMELVPVRALPRRPFQGWRYLEAGKAPPDLRAGTTRTEAELEGTLAALGLL